MLKPQNNTIFPGVPLFILFLFLETKPVSLIHMSSPTQTSESQDRAFKLQFYGGVGACFNLAPMLPEHSVPKL